MISAWGHTHFFRVPAQNLAGELLRVRVVDPILDAAECVCIELSDAAGRGHLLRVPATLLAEDLPTGRAAWAILAFVALTAGVALALVYMGAQ